MNSTEAGNWELGSLCPDDLLNDLNIESLTADFKMNSDQTEVMIREYYKYIRIIQISLRIYILKIDNNVKVRQLKLKVRFYLQGS